MRVLESASLASCKTPATSIDSSAQRIIQEETKNPEKRTNSQQIVPYCLYVERKKIIYFYCIFSKNQLWLFSTIMFGKQQILIIHFPFESHYLSFPKMVFVSISSNINEVIRAILNLYFFTRRLYTHKKHRMHTSK